MIAHLAGGFIKDHRQLSAFERRQRIIAAARPFEDISAFNFFTLNVARFPGSTRVAFEFVVERFDVIIGHAPILHLHTFEEFVLAVTFYCLAVALEIVRQEAPGHAIPVRTRTADIHAKLIGIKFTQR